MLSPTERAALSKIAALSEIVAFDSVKIYRPALSKTWPIGGLGLFLGLLGILPFVKILDWLNGGPQPHGRTFLAAALPLLSALVCALWTVNLLRGFPRLTATRQGLSLHIGLGTKWVMWDSLSRFQVVTSYAGRLYRMQMGIAQVVGPHASRRELRAKSFSIPDFFETPIETIVGQLNAARAAALGASQLPVTAAPGPTELAIRLTNFTAPWLTLALLVVLVLIFVIEYIFAVSPGNAGSLSVPTLLALGGLSRIAVLKYGEWYRLFTAPLLHGSVIHIFSNGIALLLGGRLLERLVGRLWFFAVFVVGALGGSLMSLLVSPANVVSVGASGALMGMFAALFVGAFHMPVHSPARQKLQISSVQVLIPSLLPLTSATSIGQIDYGAHFGGAISGAILAALLLKAWPKTELLPQLRPLAAGISLLGAVLFAGSATLIAINYSYGTALIPPAQLPRNPADAGARAAQLVRSYPKDPRSHMFQGEALAARKDNAGAERELRAAFALIEAHLSIFEPRLESAIRYDLAAALFNERKQDEAKDIARPLCLALATTDQAIANFRKMLSDRHLCE